MPKITKRIVDAAVPDLGGKRLYVWDMQITGFGLQVLPSGVKSYVYQYRTPEGRTRRATIGKHGDWTPDEAREDADRMRRIVKGGGDPLGARRERREAPTVNDILDDYIRSEKFAAKAETTQAVDRGRIKRHLRPTLGQRHVHTLTPEDIDRARRAIKSGKTAASVKTKPRGRARVAGGPGTARMAIELLRAIFAWAVSERMIKDNPCAHVKSGKSGTRNIILKDAKEYERLFKTLDTMERERRIRPPVADAIRLIALTGCRRGEAAGLRWSHVDLKSGLIVLPPAAHKTGAATCEPRIIGLPSACQVIIGRQPTGEPDDYVFRDSKGDGPISLSHLWRKVRVEGKLPEGIGLHGLRHSLASHMAMGGAEAAEIMTALGHTQLSTAQRYVHWAEDARQVLAEKAASVATAGLQASDGKSKAKEIVKLGDTG